MDLARLYILFGSVVLVLLLLLFQLAANIQNLHILRLLLNWSHTIPVFPHGDQAELSRGCPFIELSSPAVVPTIPCAPPSSPNSLFGYPLGLWSHLNLQSDMSLALGAHLSNGHAKCSLVRKGWVMCFCLAMLSILTVFQTCLKVSQWSHALLLRLAPLVLHL